MSVDSKLGELKEFTSANLKREFDGFEDAILTTIQSADRCEIDLMLRRFTESHRSAILLRSHAVERFSDGAITGGELASIIDATDEIVFTGLREEVGKRLISVCKCQEK